MMAEEAIFLCILWFVLPYGVINVIIICWSEDSKLAVCYTNTIRLEGILPTSGNKSLLDENGKAQRLHPIGWLVRDKFA